MPARRNGKLTPTKRASASSPPARDASASPPRTRSTGGAAKKSAPAKKTLWACYQSLLVSRPIAMAFIQSGLLAMAGKTTANALTRAPTTAQDLADSLFLSVSLITPVVTVWLGALSQWKLHWIKATAVDQFLFSPVLNVVIFYFLAAAKLTLPATTKDALTLSFTLRPAAFEGVFAAQIWMAQLRAYALWLPATIVRQKYVPPYLQGIFVNVTAYVWNIIFYAIILA